VTKQENMSVVQTTIFVALALSPALVASRGLYEEFDTGNDVDNFGRQILVTSNFTEPSTAVILGLSVAVVLAIPTIILLLMGRSAYNKNRRNDNQQHSYFGGYSNGYARSAGSSIDFSNLNVIQWIQMMQEVYDKFDYNDIECQKRLICEVMQSPEYFGETSEKVRTGFEYAKYLEFLSMPDDFREILDEYIDASERAIGTKTCQEYFDCPYSLKDSVKRNFYGNAL